MNRTSPSCRSVSVAARSPARASTGPDVTRSPTPISWATMPASDVLPSPGGPAKRRWSDGLAATPRRLEDDREVPDQLGAVPRTRVSVLGRSAASPALLARRRPGRRRCAPPARRRGSSSRRAHRASERPGAPGAARPPRCRCRRARSTARRTPRERVAELAERAATSSSHRRRAAASVGRPTTTLPLSSRRMRLAVLRPTPGTATRASTSSVASAAASASGRGSCEDRLGRARARRPGALTSASKSRARGG